MTSYTTTSWLEQPSPHGDRMLEQGVMARGELERLARYMKRYRLDPEWVTDIEVACEKARHQDDIDHWSMYEMLKPGQLWPKHPKDPISIPDRLPSIVFDDERFDPMCVYCRDRYKL